jgi:hypothetical protein
MDMGCVRGNAWDDVQLEAPTHIPLTRAISFCPSSKCYVLEMSFTQKEVL